MLHLHTAQAMHARARSDMHSDSISILKCVVYNHDRCGTPTV